MRTEERFPCPTGDLRRRTLLVAGASAAVARH